jgi:hypothetical protein
MLRSYLPYLRKAGFGHMDYFCIGRDSPAILKESGDISVFGLAHPEATSQESASAH